MSESEKTENRQAAARPRYRRRRRRSNAKTRQGNIILCGFMGCGKTSVGKRVAKLMNRQFCDLDNYIEEKTGMTVKEIFAKEGETGFRAREAQAVEEVAAQKGMVIASGGAGTKEHFYDALTEGGADAVLAASLFHYKELEIRDLKDYLASRGVSVRR